MCSCVLVCECVVCAHAHAPRGCGVRRVRVEGQPEPASAPGGTGRAQLPAGAPQGLSGCEGRGVRTWTPAPCAKVVCGGVKCRAASVALLLAGRESTRVHTQKTISALI